MSSINILNIRQADGLNEAIAELKYLFEKKIKPHGSSSFQDL